jgi:retron-type reverse transcriptase
MQHGRATKWLIEGDLSACFDRIDHSVLAAILSERFHDNRFLRLMHGLLQAGYGEEWIYHATHSGVPQGGVRPIFSNLVLDRLDKYVETPLIPADTRPPTEDNPPYVRLTVQASGGPETRVATARVLPTGAAPPVS